MVIDSKDYNGNPFASEGKDSFDDGSGKNPFADQGSPIVKGFWAADY